MDELFWDKFNYHCELVRTVSRLPCSQYTSLISYALKQYLREKHIRLFVSDEYPMFRGELIKYSFYFFPLNTILLNAKNAIDGFSVWGEGSNKIATALNLVLCHEIGHSIAFYPELDLSETSAWYEGLELARKLKVFPDHFCDRIIMKFVGN